jgi:hypothetical protein
MLADFDAEIAADHVVLIGTAEKIDGYMIAWPELEAYLIDNIAIDPAQQGVVRPGGAIDTVVNPNLIPPGAPGGPARPAVQFSSTDFWSQGVSIGLAYNY